MPDYTDQVEALRIAQNLTGPKPALIDFLEVTAETTVNDLEGAVTIYRPYAAVMMLVATDPNAVEALTGRRGIEFADRSTALKWLAKMQRALDKRLGIEGLLPTESNVAPGPRFTAWQ